jgi:hypothetical protein
MLDKRGVKSRPDAAAALEPFGERGESKEHGFSIGE